MTEHGRKQDRFMKILRSLPIWPIHSCDDVFINAESGILLPHKLPYFSFCQNINFYKCDEADFNVLFVLGATSIDELDYVKHVIPEHMIPSQEYITFLQSVLSLGNRNIEQYLEQYPAIPDESLNTLVKANTLYNNAVHLFHQVFEGTDKFLPAELRNNLVLVAALGRMGFKRQVNCNTFIECVREIESQIQQADKFPTNVVKYRAKCVIDHLYENITNLNFSRVQWNQIMNIKFVPSDKCVQSIQSPFYEKPKETSGFESFKVLCLQRYKEVCWTQSPLFERNVEPTGLFHELYPTIGMPSSEDIINHWIFVVRKIKSNSSVWKSPRNYTLVKRVIREIYEIMNKLSQQQNLKKSIGTSINEKKLFLNEEDPFDKESWVSGRELVFDIPEDIKRGGLYKVNECLEPYKDLLILAGAIEVEEMSEEESDDECDDQKDLLFNNLLDQLIRHPDTKHHDVIFIVGSEKIGANRYVLSGILYLLLFLYLFIYLLRFFIK